MENYKEVTPRQFEQAYAEEVRKFLDGNEKNENSPVHEDTYLCWHGMKCNIGSGADMFSYIIDGLAKRVYEENWTNGTTEDEVRSLIVDLIKNKTPYKNLWYGDGKIGVEIEGSKFAITCERL